MLSAREDANTCLVFVDIGFSGGPSSLTMSHLGQLNSDPVKALSQLLKSSTFSTPKAYAKQFSVFKPLWIFFSSSCYCVLVGAVLPVSCARIASSLEGMQPEKLGTRILAAAVSSQVLSCYRQSSAGLQTFRSKVIVRGLSLSRSLALSQRHLHGKCPHVPTVTAPTCHGKLSIWAAVDIS